MGSTPTPSRCSLPETLTCFPSYLLGGVGEVKINKSNSEKRLWQYITLACFPSYLLGGAGEVNTNKSNSGKHLRNRKRRDADLLPLLFVRRGWGGKNQ